MKFSKSEKRHEHRISDKLRKIEHHAKNPILSRLRHIVNKKGIMFMLTVATLFTKIPSSYAGTADLKPKVVEFNNWFMSHDKEIEDGTVTWDEVINKFRASLDRIDKEVKDDLKNHRYFEAKRLLDWYYRLADRLGDDKFADEILDLKIEVEKEIRSYINEDGIYRSGNDILISGHVSAHDLGTAMQQSGSNGKGMVLEYVQKHKGTKSIMTHGFRITNMYNLSEANQYRYVGTISTIGDEELTKEILESLPHVPVPQRK